MQMIKELRFKEKHGVKWDNLSSLCDTADVITITMANGKVKKLHKKQQSKDHWVGGVDDITFEYVRSSDGNIVGSMVDGESHAVSHFLNDAEGNPYVEEIPVEDFPEERDPIEDDDGKGDRFLKEEIKDVNDNEEGKLRGTSKAASNAGVRVLNLDGIEHRYGPRNLNDNGDVLDVMVVWTIKAECRAANQGTS